MIYPIFSNILYLTYLSLSLVNNSISDINFFVGLSLLMSLFFLLFSTLVLLYLNIFIILDSTSPITFLINHDGFITCNNFLINSYIFVLIISKETTSQILGKLNTTSFLTFSLLSSTKYVNCDNK